VILLRSVSRCTSDRDHDAGCRVRRFVYWLSQGEVGSMDPAARYAHVEHIIRSTIARSAQHVFKRPSSVHRSPLTFQNCLLASLPPTLFKILAPPGCSSTNPSILYTSLSMMMCKPLSTLPASLTSLAVNSFDILVDFGRGIGSGLLCALSAKESKQYRVCIGRWLSMFLYSLVLLPRMEY
jgi:hypothetical protein